jgi:hypothetical protein
MEEIVAHLFSLIFYSFHPSEADCLVSEQLRFYGVRLLVSRPTPNLEEFMENFSVIKLHKLLIPSGA